MNFLFNNVFYNPINLFFVSVIVFLAVWDLFSFLIAKGKYHRSFKNEIVTIGILGTFVGIFIGLVQFDVTNITDSIPPLLEGMKTAFITSIAGLSASTFIALIQKVKSSPYAKSGNPMTDKLAEQSRLLAEFLNESKETNKELIEQVKNHRVESKDELMKVRGSLDQTLAKLSEGATKEIIQALEKVITDFNQNLTQQFGENFKQLNEACLKLLQWQENYKESITQTEQRLTVFIEKTKTILSAITGSMTTTAKSIETIAGRNKEFEKFCNNTAISLNTMNKMLNHNTKLQESMKESIDELNTAANQLKGIPSAFTAVSTKLDENNKQMINALENTNTILRDDIKQTSESVRQLNTNTNKEIQNLMTSASEAVNKLNADIAQATKNLNDALVSLTNQFGNNYRQFLDEIDALMRRNQ